MYFSVTIRKEAPVISSELSDLTIKDGELLCLQCTVLNGANCTVCWYHNERPLVPTELLLMDYDGTVAKLQILKARREHEGDYLCVFTTMSGKAITAAKVNVTGKLT